MFSSPNTSLASSSLQPQQPYSMGVKTVVGTYLQFMHRLPSANRRLASSFPAIIAVGVNSRRPFTQSPIAQMLGTAVLSSSPARILPLGAVLMPRASKLRPLVSAERPMAKSTVSKTSSISSSPCLNLTTFSPFLFRVIEMGTVFLRNWTPFSPIQLPILLAICWSKPLRKMERTMTVTSSPRACRNPPHSREIQEAPMQRVRPGLWGSQKMSSELMACSFPGILGSEGRPPVAMRMFLAVTTSVVPSAAVSSIEFAVNSLANLLKQVIFSSFSFLRQPQLMDLMQSVIFSETVSQAWGDLLSIVHPAQLRSSLDSPKSPAQWNSFFGMHPTLTQVPPSPHLVPPGEGLTKSAKPTLAPFSAAIEAEASPPEPPPITKKSQVNSCCMRYVKQYPRNLNLQGKQPLNITDEAQILIIFICQPSPFRVTMNSDLASRHHKNSTGRVQTYQLLLNQSVVRYATMSPRRLKDNMFTEDFPNFIGEERNCRPIGGAKLMNRLKLNFETKARKASKNKMKNQDSKQLVPVKYERNPRLTTEPQQLLYKDAKLRVHSSIEVGQQTLKQHKVYSKGELKPCRLKIKTHRDGLWKATERQRKNYLDKTALLGEISFKKPLIDHSGQKYFEYLLRDRWKDDLKLPQFVYQFKKNDQFSSERSIQNLKKQYPNLLERKRMALQGRGVEKE